MSNDTPLLARIINRSSRSLSLPARRASASLRCLPDFLVVGSQRGGTTSLHYWLSQHPQLFCASLKEVHFFDGGPPGRPCSYARGLKWYKAHFPLRSVVGSDGLAFEASPRYLFHPLAPERASQVVPGARIVALLRNPTERAVSHYFHSRSKGREPLSISAAFAAESQRLAPILASGDYKAPGFLYHSYKARGEYAVQIENWLQVFPRSQFLFLKSEDLFASPLEQVGRVLAFLGVEPGPDGLDYSARNLGVTREPVEAEVKNSLDRHFAPHNARLADLLGPEFDWTS